MLKQLVANCCTARMLKISESLCFPVCWLTVCFANNVTEKLTANTFLSVK